MKIWRNIFAAVFILIVSFETISAQTATGDKELSVAASFMSRKYEDREAWTVLNIPVRLGFFVNQNVEIEPEMMFTSYEEEDLGYIFSGNLAYNFTLPNPNSMTVPFIFAGFGYSNTIIYLPGFTWPGDEEDSWTVISLGGGIKFFLPKPAALRLEYRLQKFAGDDDYTVHNIYFGMSVFLGCK